MLNLKTGVLKKCYCGDSVINIFENPDEPIPFSAIGYNCTSSYCVNSSHFLSLGVIPDIQIPTYAQLRNRICDDQSEWLTGDVKTLFETKLFESNEEYTCKQKRKINRQYETPITIKTKAYIKNALPKGLIEKYDQIKSK